MKLISTTNPIVRQAASLRLYTTFPHPGWPAVAIGLALLSAVLIPLNLLTGQRFHHDEALYATWALQIASGHDPLLQQTLIDKPPLFLYTMAGAMRLLGVTEVVARLPSLLATVLSVGLTFGLGQQLYGRQVGVLAAWLVALSPLTILFAPTAFTDPMLVTLVLAAGLAAAHDRAGWAGVGMGLAIATKQQGLFFIPLVMGLLLVSRVAGSKVAGRRSQVAGRKVAGNKVAGGRVASSRAASGRVASSKVADSKVIRNTQHATRNTSLALRVHVPRFTFHVSRFTLHASARFFLAMSLTLIPVFLWDFTRDQPLGFWQQSMVNYGQLTTDAASFSQRWFGFTELLQYGTASPTLNMIFILGMPLLLLYGTYQAYRTKMSTQRDRGNTSTAQEQEWPTHQLTTQPDWLFSLFTLTFLLGHAWLSFQVWDRYLLGLIPLLALLLARVLLLPWSILKDHWLDRQPAWRPVAGVITGLVLSLLLALTLARPVQDAANARYPLGSHSNALQGIEQITAYLQGHVGANTTLYHRWLGTHWRFYLWNYPYDLQYWSSPQALAAKAQPGHLIAFPGWRSETEARLALDEVGLGLRELTRAYTPAGYPSVILYQIETKE